MPWDHTSSNIIVHICYCNIFKNIFIVSLLVNQCDLANTVIVLYTEEWVCDVALIKCTLSPGEPKGGWDFGGEGTRGQWGTKGVSLQSAPFH